MLCKGATLRANARASLSGDLDDATYNMTLGSAFLGQLVSQFDGSYVMAAAAYNAGPGRPPQWAETCGDPRGAGVDPVNFIECIPPGPAAPAATMAPIPDQVSPEP